MGNDSTGILLAVTSILSPDPPTPDFLQASLVHSALPLLEPRLSGCKLNCVHWPCKRLSAYVALIPWQTETLLLFTAGCYLGSFAACCCTLGSPAWDLDPKLLRGNDPAADLSLWNFSCCLLQSSQASCSTSALPTSLFVVKWFLP